jgi:hypothetical protein
LFKAFIYFLVEKGLKPPFDTHPAHLANSIFTIAKSLYTHQTKIIPIWPKLYFSSAPHHHIKTVPHLNNSKSNCSFGSRHTNFKFFLYTCGFLKKESLDMTAAR